MKWEDDRGNKAARLKGLSCQEDIRAKMDGAAGYRETQVGGWGCSSSAGYIQSAVIFYVYPRLSGRRDKIPGAHNGKKPANI